MTTTTGRPARPPAPAPGGHLCLPLPEVIARIDVADALGSHTVRLTADGPRSVDLALDGRRGTAVRRLLAGAAAHGFDTVRVTHGTAGPVVGVCRRRRRARR